jgi:hypothetical protein
MKHSKNISILFLLACISCNSIGERGAKEVEKPVDPFSKIKFDKAIAYDFAGDTDIPLLDSNNHNG